MLWHASNHLDPCISCSAALLIAPWEDARLVQLVCKGLRLRIDIAAGCTLSTSSSVVPEYAGRVILFVCALTHRSQHVRMRLAN
jgi:hypothetical protein